VIEMLDTQADAAATAEQYELGRSDGVADGTVDYDWNRERISGRVMEIRLDVRDAFLTASRKGRAYVLGYARGYREAAL
jgi:hypothetical protein